MFIMQAAITRGLRAFEWGGPVHGDGGHHQAGYHRQRKAEVWKSTRKLSMCT